MYLKPSIISCVVFSFVYSLAHCAFKESAIALGKRAHNAAALSSGEHNAFLVHNAVPARQTTGFARASPNTLGQSPLSSQAQFDNCPKDRY